MRRIARIPVPLLVVGCLVVAAVYVPVWPEDAAAELSGATFLVLRWGHPLAWLLLAMACATYGWTGSVRAAAGLAAAAGVCYLLFFTVLATR